MKTFPITHPLDNGTDNWVISNIEEMFPTFCDNLFISDQIVYSKKLEVFKGSDILLIGGGPSCESIHNTDFIYYEYDYVWSMNNFFMNPKMSNIVISLAMFGANTHLSDYRLGQCLEKDKPYLVFEPHPKYGFIETAGHKENSDWKNARKIINGRDYSSELKAVCQTAYWSRIGIGARMILLAAHLGVKSIDFIGIDGFPSYKTGSHFFEKNKGIEALPSSIKNLSHIEMKTIMFNEYKELHNLLKDFPIKINNLAKNNPNNYINIFIDQ